MLPQLGGIALIELLADAQGIYFVIYVFSKVSVMLFSITQISLRGFASLRNDGSIWQDCVLSSFDRDFVWEIVPKLALRGQIWCEYLNLQKRKSMIIRKVYYHRQLCAYHRSFFRDKRLIM